MEFETKYDFKFADCAVENDINRLTNQLWKLIPMREKDEDWCNQLSTVIIEIAGLNEIFFDEARFLVLLSKLEGLKALDLDFKIYRKTIFETISLLRGILHG